MIKRTEESLEYSEKNTSIVVADVVAEETRPSSAPKLDVPLKTKVIAMLARGERYGTIQRILKEDHGIDYSESALSQLRKSHADTIAQIEAMVIEKEASESEQIRTKALRQLSRKLDQSSADDQELAKLDSEYRNDPDMTLSDYRRRKAGLLNLSVFELVTISKEMHSQSAKGRAASIAAGSTDGSSTVGGADPALLEALMAAIQSGDTITLQQMIINPNANGNPT